MSYANSETLGFQPMCPIAEIINDETGLSHEQIQEVAIDPTLSFAERFGRFNLDSLDVIEMVMIFEGFTSAVSASKTNETDMIIHNVVPIEACEFCAKNNNCSLLGLFKSTLDEDNF